MTAPETDTASDTLDASFATALTTFISETVALDDDPIDADTDLLMTGLVDSLGVVMIVDWIESTLAVQVDPGDVVLENFQTIGSMLRYLGTA